MIPRRQTGYALLTVIFLAAVMTIAAAAVLPSVLQQGRRQKELETIWRGKQYARAVKLFYRKTGRFPQSLDELTKSVNNVRFMRQAYPDPFNGSDGSWRLIYVGPLGQLIGSVKSPAQGGTIQLPGTLGTPAAALATPPGGAQPGQQQGQPGQPGQPGQQGQGLQGNQPLIVNTPAGANAPSAPQTAPSGQVIGGNIIGVGSKVNQRSVIVYDGGATYREWEFIWNPAKDPITVGGAGPGSQVGTPIQGPPPGANPPGMNPPGMNPPPPPPPPRQPQN